MGSYSLTADGQVVFRGSAKSVVVQFDESPPPPPVVVPPVVTPPPVVPPATSGSNEPTGMAVIADRRFVSLNEPDWNDSGLTIASDPSAPTSPPNVLRATFNAGSAGGSAPGYAERSHDGFRTLYIDYRGKLSSNFYGHPTGVNKQFYEWAGGKPIFFLEAFGGGNGTLTPRVVLQGTPADAVLNPNVVPTASVPRGQWYRIEVLLTGNTAGNADGSVEWWLDGVKVGSQKGLRFTSGLTQFDICTIRSIWGGQGGTVPATMTFDIDNFRMSGKN